MESRNTSYEPPGWTRRDSVVYDGVLSYVSGFWLYSHCSKPMQWYLHCDLHPYTHVLDSHHGGFAFDQEISRGIYKQ